MNSQQAKFILQGYRPDGADAADETFADALAQARQDAELGQWLAKSTAFDRVVVAKLNDVRPPVGLREAILAGGRVTIADQPPAAKLGWRGAARWVVAASVALLGAVSVGLWSRRVPANGTLPEFALADARSLHGHLDFGPLSAELQTKLSEPTMGLARLRMPDYAALRSTGCRTVKFQGRDVLEVCFKRDGVWFHCYIARREDFPTVAAALTPSFAEHGKASVASWADAAHLYVVVSKSGRAALEKIL
jgi:hypothetical protein